jgi:hypothetical protein
MRKGIILGFLMHSGLVYNQTPQKWAETVSWDGITPWINYMIYSSSYMGPNALPVPDMANGSVDSLSYVSFSSVLHFSKGDKTQNLQFFANHRLVKNRLSAEVLWIPIEWFDVNDATKIKRRVYYSDYYDNKAQGDVFFNFKLQMLNRWRKYIHLALRAGFRYPTSSSVGAARYTDAPGYHFDLSFAKPFFQNKLKLTLMGGLYVWQLNTSGQDDAFLFGGGMEYNYKNLRWRINCRGYSGYRNNGDRPLILESLIEKQFGNFGILLNLHKGLIDYDFTTVSLGSKFIFNKKQLIKQ